MLSQTSPLGAQIATIQTALAGRETCAWVPDAVHALITAIFARIFDSLEQLILRWQSGTLPAAPIRPPHASAPATAPHPAAPRTPNPAAHRATPRTRARATIRAIPSRRPERRQEPTLPAPPQTKLTAATSRFRTRIRPAHHPPANPSQKPPLRRRTIASI